MLTAEQKKSVSAVANGLKRRLPESDIIRLLLPLGLTQEHALEAFQLIRNGIQAGVNSAVMNGLPKQQFKRGESELYDAAFDEGYKAFKNQLWQTWLGRALAAVAAIVVGIIVFHWMKPTR